MTALGTVPGWHWKTAPLLFVFHLPECPLLTSAFLPVFAPLLRTICVHPADSRAAGHTRSSQELLTLSCRA